jgi:hypothetical protein
LAFKSQLTILLRSVRGATGDPGIAKDRSRWRGPGTCLPGVVSSGTFHQHRERIFWDVRSANAVVSGLGLGLGHEKYRRLIIEVPCPNETVQLIAGAIRH